MSNSTLNPNPNSVTPHKQAFLQTCLASSILQFGTFTLKSGRVSPYFFNAGLFHRGDLLRALASVYAECIAGHQPKPLEFDIIFGPAYKAIPLATATLISLSNLNPSLYSHVSYAFNRKEAKDHGEGGRIVGAPLAGKRVLIVDDVITAGTAIRDAVRIIQQEGGVVVGIMVALDRGERVGDEDNGSEVDSRKSAIGQIRKELSIPVLAVLTLDDIISGLEGMGSDGDLKRLEEYRMRYKATE